MVVYFAACAHHCMHKETKVCFDDKDLISLSSFREDDKLTCRCLVENVSISG